MNGCPSRTEQPQEPDPRTSHSEEDQDQVTWQPRGESESKNKLPACQTGHSPTQESSGLRARGLQNQGLDDSPP